MKVVQQMLGHKSATMTLDLYGHLFGDRLDVWLTRWTLRGPLRSLMCTRCVPTAKW
ncbi:MAG: hypothetical protein ACJ8DJ_00125 [Gemmatimonadales bacterium]